MSIARRSEQEERFHSVVAVVYEPLQRYLGRRADPADASEVLNDTLAVVWRRLDDVSTRDPLPWTYGVAKRCLANHRRGDRRRRGLAQRVAGEPGNDRANAPGWTGATEAALAMALDELGESDRELIRLWAWERLEPREIAIVIDATADAVSSRLTRVKRRLAESLERQDPESAGQKVSGHGKVLGS